VTNGQGHKEDGDQADGLDEGFHDESCADFDRL
jgi:hypothetical protein